MSMSWNVYPRPQMKRDSFVSLCGEWDFAVCQKGSEPSEYNAKILVPYPPQSSLSGFEGEIGREDVLFYRRRFAVPTLEEDDRLLLHFGAVDNHAEIYISGNKVFEHAGGYLPFSVDITEWIAERNELVVKVIDTLDHDYPYGKQRIDRGGMWYTPTSGIWQTVWLEVVPREYIRSLKVDVTLESATITVNTEAKSLTAELLGDEGKVCIEGNTVTVIPAEKKLWTPETPYLYRLKITADKDSVETYFALRTLETKTVNGVHRLCLNGHPYFFHGLLDQGYFADGIFLPKTPDGYTKDIETAKSLGFNTLRKHIKIEPECFYYDCDRLGMIVFQDFVNNSDYSFVRDTALPTVGLKRLKDKHLKRTEKAKEIFVAHSKETVEHLYNHPSICLWTVFNEGWGQFEADRLYAMVRSWDKSRFVDATSGWFWQTESDVESLHVYFKKIKLPKKAQRPIIVSEFGGYCYAVKDHLFDEKKSYGYRNCQMLEQYNEDFARLYETEVIPLIEKGLCATIYTQISDVEEEINGIMTYDREVVKPDKDRALDIARKMKI
ncbi:MAG: glycoside hydrolase family 2 [Clostridia bacterium]|nr:glycoside hydrolase family 2 [Clostridia bacterium]